MNRHFYRWMPVAFLFAAWSCSASFGCLCSLDNNCWFAQECPDGTCAQCCSDDECDYPESCFSGRCSVDCNGEFCECCRDDVGCDCCRDSECGPFQYCENVADESRWGIKRVCAYHCLEIDEDCDQPGLFCCSDYICAPDEKRCEQPCQMDEDCAERPGRYAADMVCMEQLCRLVPCAEQADCEAHQFCLREICVSQLDCEELAYCTVEPEHLLVQVGQQSLVTATAFLRNHESAPTDGFTWTSSDESVVEVDLEGILTAVAEGGPVEVTAQVIGCDLTCFASVEVVTQ